MPRNATTALYTRVSNSFSVPVVGTPISPTDADTFFDDVEASMNSFIGTSTTSLLIATGSKSFTTQADKSFLDGSFVQCWSQANIANYMYGTVTSYNETTGELVVDVLVTGGAGTLADWLIVTAGARGATGPTGATGGVNSIAGNTGAFTLGTGLTNSTNDLKVTLPYFSASLSANQNTTTTAVNKVLFNTELADSNSWYDNATNYRFTPLVAGKYKISATVTVTGTTVTELRLDIYKNGATYSRTVNIPTGNAATERIEQIVSFNGSTDYVEIFGSATGTGTLVFLGGAAPIRSWFEATYLGA